MSPRARAVAPPARPMVVAHRGASSVAAEHTLAAYEAAIASGADALECDVRLSRDGHLVCVHDRTVNRTSDGRGVVSTLDLQTLDALDFSSWYSSSQYPSGQYPSGQYSSGQYSSGRDTPGRPLAGTTPDTAEPYLAGVAADRVVRGGGVLTLDLLLQLVRDADREVRLLIETKHPTRYGGLVESTLVDLLRRFGWAGRHGPPVTLDEPADPNLRVAVMSFAPTALRRVRLLAPDIPTVVLFDRYLPPKRRTPKLPTGVAIAGPGLTVLRADPDFVARAHARGLRVFVWTVDDPDDVAYVLDLGVDTVITDRPAEVRAQVDVRS